MSVVADIERELLSLPAAERERLVLRAWESLVDEESAASNPAIDPESVELAIKRDSELKEKAEKLISHEEFVRRTSGE